MKQLTIYETIQNEYEKVVNNEPGSDPVALYIRVKGLLNFVTETEKLLKGHVLKELHKYKEKTVSLHGYKFSKKDLADTYDLEKNPTYKELNDQLKALKKAINQASKSNQVVLDEDGVVVAEPVPVKSPGGESFSVTQDKDTK